MEKQRIYYWDNLKAILVFLVVLGHFLLPSVEEGKMVESIYIFIYLFHMPAFVFVSGYFAKYYMKKDVPQINKLLGFLVLFLGFKVLLWITKSLLLLKFVKFDIFGDRSAPWYLLAMFFWYVFLPIFDRFKPVISIGIAVVMALLIGTNSDTGFFLCISRTVVFLPFFLVGYYFKEQWVEKITVTRNKVLALIFLLAMALFVFFRWGAVGRYSSLIFGSASYSRLNLDNLPAMGARFVWFVVAGAIVLAVMCLVSKKKTFYSYIGSRTLAVYILHRIIRQVFEELYLYKYFNDNEIILIVVCLAISIVITYVCSLKPFHNLFQKAFEIKYDKVLAKNRK